MEVGQSSSTTLSDLLKSSSVHVHGTVHPLAKACYCKLIHKRGQGQNSLIDYLDMDRLS